MGVHIYSGSLIRFYTNDWENEIQRWARENGVEYQASGSPTKWPSVKEVKDHLAWMRSLLAEEVGPGHFSWDDDTPEYHTLKVHEEGRDAIALVAANLHRPDLPMPQLMPENLMADPAYAEAGKKGYLIGPIAAFDASLILPGDFDGVRLIESPLRENVLVCSTAFLRAALAFVEKGWSGAVHAQAWVDRGLVYARGSGSIQNIDGVRVEKRDAEPANSVKGNAEFAFGVYSSLLAFSADHNTAIGVW